MKKKTTFFFFLLIFIQCSHDDKRTLSVLPGIGVTSAMPGNRYSPGEKVHLPGSADSSGTKISSANRQGKRKKTLTNHDGEKSRDIFRRNNDSIFIDRLNFLRSNRIDLDLNEPVSKNFLFSPIETQKSPSMITVSSESFLSIHFDNDIIDYTDRFYTNGIKIDLITPGLAMNPVRWHCGHPTAR